MDTFKVPPYLFHESIRTRPFNRDPCLALIQVTFLSGSSTELGRAYFTGFCTAHAWELISGLGF